MNSAFRFPSCNLWLAGFGAMLLALNGLSAAPIRFQLKKQGFVSVLLYNAEDIAEKSILADQPMKPGTHEIPVGESDGILAPGNYVWKAFVHDGITLELRGWIGDWCAGDLGTPSAAVADMEQVYLGWSLASPGSASVMACDSSGQVRWNHQRGKSSGCRALAVDGPILYVLGGEGDDAEGAVIYRLSTKDGSPVAWRDGRMDLKIASLWPADDKPKPCLADFMAVKNGRIYLSFTKDEFAAVLDASTGLYLQTLVGAPPGPIDAVATKSDLLDNPGDLVEADFVVTALQGGTIGKILCAHDPIWVLASDLTPLDRNEKITALRMNGDDAKYRRHDIFVAMGFPFNQVQARPALDTEQCSYMAGESGGRPQQGAWKRERMSFVRGLAMDGTGNLWVAEGASSPKRISIWSTDSKIGELKREFFSAPGSKDGVPVHPNDPMILVADGCEWRIDPGTGRATCLGIISPDPMQQVRFISLDKNRVLLAFKTAGGEKVLERKGDADYHPYEGPVPGPDASSISVGLARVSGGIWALCTSYGAPIPDVLNPSRIRSRLNPAAGKDWPLESSTIGSPRITKTRDGRVFVTAGTARTWNLEVMGLKSLRQIATGRVTLPPTSQP